MELEGSIPTTFIYRKVTYTDQYWSFSSQHPTYQNLGVVHTLASKSVDTVSNPDGLQAEKNHLKEALHKCENLDRIVKKGLQQSNSRHSEPLPISIKCMFPENSIVKTTSDSGRVSGLKVL